MQTEQDGKDIKNTKDWRDRDQGLKLANRFYEGVAMVFWLLPLAGFLTMGAASPQADGIVAERPLKARYLITAADDFIVDVFLNGKPVPDAKRTLLEERFGATVERIDVEVHRGDWIVFNVVNNRLRWGGSRYLGVAGCFAPNEFGFVSDRASRNWSACDNPRDACRFIARKRFLSRQHVQIIDNPWTDGDALMRQHAGETWNGTPLWGAARNTWVKVLVE